MAKRPHYRDFAVHCCRRLRVLDYRKVKLAERQAAADLFFDAAAAAPTPLAVQLSSTEPGAIAAAAADDKTFIPGEITAVQGGKVMTEEERARVRKAIEDAESVDEVRRLQRMLEQGFLPTAKTAPVPVAAAAPAAAEAEEEEEAEPEPAPKGRGKKGAAATKKAAAPATRAKAGGRTTRGSRKADAMDED